MRFESRLHRVELRAQIVEGGHQRVVIDIVTSAHGMAFSGIGHAGLLATKDFNSRDTGVP